MALGKRKPVEPDFWTPTAELPKAPGNPFYRKLNALLEKAGFDAFVERICAAKYAPAGRPGVPLGVFFRMLFVGYFEGIESQRGIAWRCSDSGSIREFLGLAPTRPAPDHSTFTYVRRRLPDDIFDQVFTFVLGIAVAKKLFVAKTVGIDATTLEADAAMKSIVRKDNGENWKEYLTRLAKEAGIEKPTAADLARFDRNREDKKVSNKDWKSETDEDARIAKMKDGTTHMAYKTEHAVDLDTGLILAATVHHADVSDGESVHATLAATDANCRAAGSDAKVEELAADRGYHKAATLAECEEKGVRTYIPERKQKNRRWTDKHPAQRRAFHNNRKRLRTEKERRICRKRSEAVERSFAHTCETGGGRRTRLRGLRNVANRHRMLTAAHNLGVIMRAVFGVGTPRTLQGNRQALSRAFSAWRRILRRTFAGGSLQFGSAFVRKSPPNAARQLLQAISAFRAAILPRRRPFPIHRRSRRLSGFSSTGC